MEREHSNSRAALREQLARGDYRVDPDAVAEAVVRKMLTRRHSGVLVAAEPVDRLSVRTLELQPRSWGDHT